MAGLFLYLDERFSSEIFGWHDGERFAHPREYPTHRMKDVVELDIKPR